MSADPAGTSEAADAAPPASPTDDRPDGEQRHLRPVPDTTGEGSAQRTAAPEATEHAEDETTETASEPESPEMDRPSWVSRLDLSALLAWGQATFTPQSGLWSQRPAAPDEVLDRARRGSQVAEAGPLRTLSIADGYAAATTKAALRCGDWLLEHPARRVVAAVLLAVALTYPPTRMVLGYALTPAVWAHDLLT